MFVGCSRFYILILLNVISCTLSDGTILRHEFVNNYLRQFGYLHEKFEIDKNDVITVNDEKEENTIKEIKRKAISLFQINHALEITVVTLFNEHYIKLTTGHIINANTVAGEVDTNTIEMMRMSRCGNSERFNEPDEYHTVSGHVGHVLYGHLQRHKRYVLVDSKWTQRIVLYKIIKYSKKLKQFDTEKAIQRAFMTWSRSTYINFERAADNTTANINISFVTGKHGDFQKMDGKGGVLAHAFPPKYGGAIHFDDDEDWVTSGGYKGVTNLYQVAVHEIGHALGMGHSKVNESVMFPTYKGYDEQFKLAKDDIKGIQAIYGGFYYRGIMDADHHILP